MGLSAFPGSASGPIGLGDSVPAGTSTLKVDWEDVLLSVWVIVSLMGFQRGPSLVAPAPESEDPGTAVSIRFENDLFRDTDRFYTNGFSVAWAKQGEAQGWTDRVWRGLGAYDWFEGMPSHVNEFGQIIVTPADTTLSVPDPTDRPYAGILYLGQSLQFQTASKINVIKGIVGIMGPWALGEEAQNGVHGLFGFDEAQGWDHQLENEPVFNLVYERRYRRRLPPRTEPWAWEVITISGGMLGNILTQIQGGVQLRAGYALPDDFGTSLIRGAGNLPPSCRCWPVGERRFLGWHVFAGINANAVARNATLDGNLFQDSPSVERKPYFGGAEYGVSFVFRRFEITYSRVIWGEEFEGQPDDSEFGAFVVSFGL